MLFILPPVNLRSWHAQLEATPATSTNREASAHAIHITSYHIILCQSSARRHAGSARQTGGYLRCYARCGLSISALHMLCWAPYQQRPPAKRLLYILHGIHIASYQFYSSNGLLDAIPAASVSQDATLSPIGVVSSNCSHSINASGSSRSIQLVSLRRPAPKRSSEALLVSQLSRPAVSCAYTDAGVYTNVYASCPDPTRGRISKKGAAPVTEAGSWERQRLSPTPNKLLVTVRLLWVIAEHRQPKLLRRRRRDCPRCATPKGPCESRHELPRSGFARQSKKKKRIVFCSVTPRQVTFFFSRRPSAGLAGLTNIALGSNCQPGQQMSA